MSTIIAEAVLARSRFLNALRAFTAKGLSALEGRVQVTGDIHDARKLLRETVGDKQGKVDRIDSEERRTHEYSR